MHCELPKPARMWCRGAAVPVIADELAPEQVLRQPSISTSLFVFQKPGRGETGSRVTMERPKKGHSVFRNFAHLLLAGFGPQVYINPIVSRPVTTRDKGTKPRFLLAQKSSNKLGLVFGVRVLCGLCACFQGRGTCAAKQRSSHKFCHFLTDGF